MQWRLGVVFGGLAVAFYFISEPLGHWLGAMGIASTEYPWMVPTLTSVAILVASLLVALWAGIHGPRLAWTSLFATLISLAILWTAGGLVGLLLPAGQWAAIGSELTAAIVSVVHSAVVVFVSLLVVRVLERAGHSGAPATT